MGLNVLTDKCIGCEACVHTCPFGAMEMRDGKAFVLENCTSCGNCLEACNFESLELIKEEVALDGKDEYKDIWVFAEQKGGHIANVVYELLGEGRRLADALGVKLGALLLGGSGIAALAGELIASGADVAYVAQHDILENFNDDPYTDVISGLIGMHKPQAVLMGATSVGRSLAPRVATKVGTGLTADCTGLDIDPETKNLMQTRPAFGGNLMAT
jgi:NAD-dependent dihydropyrimidine dehydrogenase PreA subunit